MGSPVETLADLVPTTPRIVCVGINPAPTSVSIGHYYQGRLGQRLYDRFRQVGLLPARVGRRRGLQQGRRIHRHREATYDVSFDGQRGRVRLRNRDAALQASLMESTTPCVRLQGRSHTPVWLVPGKRVRVVSSSGHKRRLCHAWTLRTTDFGGRCPELSTRMARRASAIGSVLTPWLLLDVAGC